MAAVLTTLTTSVGFASLLTANVFGLNALGLLTIIGISMALLTTLVVLPCSSSMARRSGVQVGDEILEVPSQSLTQPANMIHPHT